MKKKELDEQIKKITDQLIKKYRPEKIILFGSSSTGTFNQNSDVDLLVIKNGLENVPRHRRSYLARKTVSSELPVDLLVYTSYEIQKRLYLGDPFFKRVLEEGKVLYGT